LAFLSVAFAGLAPIILHEQDIDTISGEYIVVFKEIEQQSIESELTSASSKYDVMHQYRHALKGYAAKLTEEQLLEVRNNPLVDYVEVNQVVRAEVCSAPVAVTSWGLTRIAETILKLDGFYAYPGEAGEGVIAYVIDTGIYVANTDFRGRATFGFKASNSWSNTDGNGHGTHVASTIVGQLFGVARKATAVAVKVLGDNGSGTDATVIAGIDWVTGQYLSHKKPSVANLSLGGGKSTTLNAAANAAVNAGVVMVVAAGNSNADACNGSPASATEVISVGSTDVGVGQVKDVRSYFSNFGKCVHIFAPGSDITAAWIGSPTATNTISGTSMASPHVAGIVALLLSANPGATPAFIKGSLIGSANADLIDLQCSSTVCSASPNLLAFNGCDRHPN